MTKIRRAKRIYTGLKVKHGQALLLTYLFRKHGGATAIAFKMGLPKHRVVNWSRDGAVPAKYIPMLSKLLKVPIWGLNYKAAAFLEPDSKVPSWESVAKLYNLEDSQVRDIIKKGEP